MRIYYLVQLLWITMQLFVGRSLHRVGIFWIPARQDRNRLAWDWQKDSPSWIGSCLIKALLGRELFLAAGHRVHLVMGIHSGLRVHARVRAHAWLEDMQGRILIGDLPDLNQYRRLKKI